MSPAVLHTICGKPPTVFWFATLTGHAHSDSKSRVNRLPGSAQPPWPARPHRDHAPALRAIHPRHVGDKTAVYISHRLSSCKFCDDIAVFDHGAIVQYGTHDQLVADENGKYYELWHAQAQYYVKE